MKQNREIDDELKRKIEKRDAMIARNRQRAEDEMLKPGTLAYFYDLYKTDIKSAEPKEEIGSRGRDFGKRRIK